MKSNEHFFERMGLFLGGTFVALGAEMRGWIEYNSDVKYWLLGILVALAIAIDHFRGKSNADATNTSVRAKDL